jgi:hypothetical protein
MQQLTPAEHQAVMEVLRRRGHHAVSGDAYVEDLLARWERFVQEVQSGYEFTIYDYVNDLNVRETLAEISELQPSLKDKLATRLSPADSMFRENTTAIPRTLYKFGAASAWWYYRVPLRPGDELREDLRVASIECEPNRGTD